MIAHFNIDFDDIFALQKNAIKVLKRHKVRKWGGGLFGFIGLFFWLYLTDKGFATSLIYAFILLLITPYIYAGVTLLKIKRTLENNRYDLWFTGQCKLTMNSEELCLESDNSSKRIKWSQIKKASEDEKRYFLYTSELQGITMKKFPDNFSEKELRGFNLFIKEHIQGLGIA